ncbi:hypothetical protein AMAG_03183 [Allomyces macrogynus ATCC 38327]|uniref:Actin-binding transcription modulator n=1 Tax=Allomyces macrogynus (strain ATCC 38327) TaxID=578462 RepID=A0A0L0S4P9_ALLM3|nr:hypothetical protein AMAG_03183 [Allomyces macrogynus ATCC 38327]|eukprot:KNE57472.1 hypothetical protein AMAG_03183 [Allomyces macrogynus ATCC 38327]
MESISPAIQADSVTYDLTQYDRLINECYNVNAEWAIATRYFNPQFLISKAKNDQYLQADSDAAKADPRLDMMLLQSPNSLCVVSLAPGHRLFAHLRENPSTTITAVRYTSQATDNLVRKLKPGSSGGRGGKRKRGGASHPVSHDPSTFHEDTLVAQIVLSDGTVFPVHAGIYGSLLQLNDALATDPTLIVKHPCNVGFLFVAKPFRETVRDVLMREEYLAARPDVDASMYPELVGPRDVDEEAAEEGPAGQE